MLTGSAIVAIIAVLAGALLGWLLAQRSKAGELVGAEQRGRAQAQEQAAAEAARQQTELATRQAAAAAEVARLQAANESQSQQLRDRSAELEQARAELKTAQGVLDAEKEQRGGAEGEIKRLSALREKDAEALTAQRKLLDEAEVKFKDVFKSLAADTLQQSNRSFLELAREQLGQLHEAAKGDAEKRQQAVEGLVKPIHDNLQKLERTQQEIEGKRSESYGALMQQIRALQEAEKALHSKADDLTSALRGQPTKWGRWGELQLKRSAELAGMLEHCDFTQQESLTADERLVRPDMIVNLPNGRNLAVDSKAPVEMYIAAMELDDFDKRQAKLKQYAEAVRRHLTELCKKAYWERLAGSPEFVVMFLPGESYFSAALEADPALLEYGVEQRVILATPTTLIALLRAVAYGWKQEQLALNARQISDAGRELYKRVRVFAEHFQKVGKGLNTASGAYNDAVGSLERSLMPQARRIQELGAGDKEELPDVTQLDTTTRQLILPELGSGGEGS